MKVSTYNKKMAEFDRKIKDLEEARSRFYSKYYDVLEEKRNERIAKDKDFFVSHFDKIMTHKDEIMNNIRYGLAIVDFFDVMAYKKNFGKVHFYQSILLSTLIRLWDRGFRYKGYPILEIRELWNSSLVKLVYIKDNKLEKVTAPFQFLALNKKYDQFIKNVEQYDRHKTVLTEYRTVSVLKELLKQEKKK